jgi:LytS/YehU family sensor histidine kinase
MLASKPLLYAIIAGTLLQLAMVLTGHSVRSVANLFAVGGMTISLLAGVLYAMLARHGEAVPALVGGLVAGGVCALIGILVSYFLGDVTAAVIAFGTISSAVAGALGGWLTSFLVRSGTSA